jgi:hypothetical protein
MASRFGGEPGIAVSGVNSSPAIGGTALSNPTV